MSQYGHSYYRAVKYSLNRKRQIIDNTLYELHQMQMDMIEAAVNTKQAQGFPEANVVIDHVRRLK